MGSFLQPAGVQSNIIVARAAPLGHVSRLADASGWAPSEIEPTVVQGADHGFSGVLDGAANS